MNKQKTFLKRFGVLPATALIALGGSWTSVCAQAQLPKQELSDVSRKLNKSTSDITSVMGKAEPLTRSVPIGNSYILGPGDSVMIEWLDIPEYSGNFTIGPDGNLYLPRLRSIRVEGLTVDELQQTLTEKMREYVYEPQLHVNPSAYRPIRVYVGGEVSRPGYYYLSGRQILEFRPFSCYRLWFIANITDSTSDLNLILKV